MAGLHDRQRCMVYLWMRYRVTDYARWKEAFDTHLAARQAGGATRESLVLRNADDPNEITVLLGWNTLEQVSALLVSANRLQATSACGLAHPFYIAHWRQPKDAFVFAIEVRRVIIAHT